MSISVKQYSASDYTVIEVLKNEMAPVEVLENETAQPSAQNVGPVQIVAGPEGPQGPTGETGKTPNIQIGEVATLEPGTEAIASITGTPEEPRLNLGIPKGDPGEPGEGGNAEVTAESIEAALGYKPANEEDIPTIPANVSAFNNDAGYITKEDIPAAPEVPVQSVNGKTGAVQLAYGDVGAEKAGAVSEHNVANDSHNDIRLLISALTTKINNFLDVDDTTADELSEVIQLIKDNAKDIETITAGKVNVADIVNDLVTNVANKPLSAAQGVVLKRLYDSVSNRLENNITMANGAYDLANDASFLAQTANSNANKAKTTAQNASDKVDDLEERMNSGEFKGEPGTPGTNGVSVVSVEQTTTSTADGGENVVTVTLSNGTKSVFKFKNGSKGSTGNKGDKGNGIKSAVLNADYTLTLTFDDGTEYTTPSIRGERGPAGKDGTPGLDGTPGADGYTPVYGVDYMTPEDKAEWEAYIATELAKRGQLKPEFAESMEWLEENGDQSKMYVLPDGFIYAYKLTTVESGPSYTNKLLEAINSDKTPFVGENGEKGYVVGQRLNSSGVQSANADYCITGFIPVKANDIIRMKNITMGTAGYYLWYNSKFTLCTPLYYENYEGTHNTGTKYNTKPDANGLFEFPAPNISELAYVRISTGVITENSIITVNEEITEGGGTTTEYVWANTGHAFVPADYEDRIIAAENDISKLKNRVTALEEAGTENGTVVSDNVEIVIPSSDVAVVGREYNIYKNTVIFGSMPVEHYDVVIKINDTAVTAYNYNEVWRFTPTTAGTYTITITVRDRKLGNSAIYATKTMTLYVVENTAVTNKKVLFIGDSLTYAGKYEAEIQHNLSSGGIVSVGTVERTVSINNTDLTTKCEGRNGWATWDYAGTWESSLTKFQSDDNVFRNPDTNKFDLSYYMQKYHSGVTLNAVCLNLGTNGVGATALNVAGMSELIARIREYSATIPILVHIPIVEAPGEFYAHLGNTSPYMQMRWVELAGEFIKEYDGTMSNVHIIPVYFNLDENNDFPKTEMAVSARNPATIKRITDGHPNTYGYLKMADVYYAHLLKYMT